MRQVPRIFIQIKTQYLTPQERQMSFFGVGVLSYISGHVNRGLVVDSFLL